MTKFLTVAVIGAGVAKTQDTEYFLAGDLLPRSDQEALRWTVTFSQLNDALEMTFDSGTTWVAVVTPTANTLTTFSFNVRKGDLINFRAAENTTIDFFRVDAEI